MPILLLSHLILTPRENVIVHRSTLQLLHLKYVLKVNTLHLGARLTIDSLSGYLSKDWEWSNYLPWAEMDWKAPQFTIYPNYCSSLSLQLQPIHLAVYFRAGCHIHPSQVLLIVDPTFLLWNWGLVQALLSSKMSAALARRTLWANWWEMKQPMCLATQVVGNMLSWCSLPAGSAHWQQGSSHGLWRMGAEWDYSAKGLDMQRCSEATLLREKLWGIRCEPKFLASFFFPSPRSGVQW